MPHPGPSTTPPRSRFATARAKLWHFWHKEIWLNSHLKETFPRGVIYATLRVVSITSTVFTETKAASRAAALSFSSLLGLGPLVAITVLVAGFALNNKDEKLAAKTLSQLITFIAPQIVQLGKLPPEQHESAATAPKSSAAPAEPKPAPKPETVVSVGVTTHDNLFLASDVQLNPTLIKMVDNFIAQGRSASSGTFGVFSLILIVLLLFKTIEDTFNEIWGVRSGRTLIMRIVHYWTILTLGAVLFFASATLLSAGTFMNMFNDTAAHLPFSVQVKRALQWSLPAFSFALLTTLLTVFYRVIPNTRVFWRAAFTGAVVVASLLMLNNILAFLYIRRVIQTQSLYGSLGFPLVVMFGLYIFWLYVLIGGQISYAVQNVHFRNSQTAWSNLTESMRERLSLIVLLSICRRFQACLPPVTASELSTLIKVPTQILNECVNRLVDMHLVTPVPPPADAAEADLRYSPARPLNRMTLFEFKTRDDNLGDAPAGVALDHVDPILAHYDTGLHQLSEQKLFKKTFEELFEEFAFEPPRSNEAKA